MANSSQTILITGATGSNGIEILKLLAAQNICVRAMVRDIRKAHSIFQAQGYAVEPSKIELVEGEDVPETLMTPLGGVNRAFLLTNSTVGAAAPRGNRAEAQQLAFVEAARCSRVEQIVKLSQLYANHNSPVRFLRYHAAIESAIQASGMAYTFLRPNLYMQGLLGFRWRSLPEVIVALLYLAMNIGFAGLYLLGGDCIVNSNGSFADAFFFSVQTFAGIGYGVLSPKTTYANYIVVIEAITDLFAIALLTGLSFARFFTAVDTDAPVGEASPLENRPIQPVLNHQPMKKYPTVLISVTQH